MFHSQCFDSLQLYRHYPQHLMAVLIYSPQPLNQKSNLLKDSMSEAITSAQAVPLWFPPALNMMSMAQVGILSKGEFGDLLIHTAKAQPKKGSLAMQLHVGAIYREYLQPKDVTSVHHWSEHVGRDLLQRYGCNRPPKRHVIIEDLRT